MRITERLKLNSLITKPNNGSKITWYFYSGVKISVSIGIVGAVSVILVIKAKQYLDLDFSGQHLAPPRFWAVPGLQNLGNNCFLNVILQALASGSSFRKYLWEIMEEYGSLSGEEGDECIPLVNSLTSLVEELCTVRHSRTIRSPRAVMLAMDHYVPNFNLTRQQDAEEAFSHLLSLLREEISEQFVRNKSSLTDLLVSSHGRFVIAKSSEEESEWQRWRHSFLGPFDGVLGSILICQSCSFQISLDFQQFHSLHVSPPVTGDGTIMAGCTLEDCFKHFFVAEHLKNYCCSNCWHTAAIEYVSRFRDDKTDIEKLQCCNKNDPCDCKSLSSLEAFPWSNNFSRTFKQLTVARGPKVLCIHLQRASYNMFGQSLKLMGHISFPRVLNLSPFMNTEVGIKNVESNLRFGQLNRGGMEIRSFPHSKYQNIILDQGLPPGKAGMAETISSETEADVTLPSIPSQHPRYRLISVVEHFGSDGNGHYMVYRRVLAKIGDEDPAALLESAIEQWFCISDSEVYSVMEQDVLNASASMLFYEKIEDF